MKKMLLLAGVATVAFSVNANACDWKPYISAKITASNLALDNSSRMVDEDGDFNKRFGLGEDSQHVWGTSFAAGVANGAIRTEIEWHRNTAARLSNTRVRTYFGEAEADGNKTKIKTNAILLNAYYDFDMGSAFTPYIGAGIGYGKTKIAMARYEDEWLTKRTTSHTNITWQIGAGVAYALNDNVSVDVGYRYIDYGKFDKKFIADGFVSRNSFQVTENELYAGIRYSF